MSRTDTCSDNSLMLKQNELERKCLHFDLNVSDVYQCPFKNISASSSDLVLNRWQAITCTNDDPVHWCISLILGVLKIVSTPRVKLTHCTTNTREHLSQTKHFIAFFSQMEITNYDKLCPFQCNDIDNKSALVQIIVNTNQVTACDVRHNGGCIKTLEYHQCWMS